MSETLIKKGKGRGRTLGAVSFVMVSLHDLNEKVRENMTIPVSRRWARELGINGEPIVGSTANLLAAAGTSPAKVVNLNFHGE
mgnify:CR=1 FL=1